MEDPDIGEFPGMSRTMAMGLALAMMVGGLYLFSASYHAPRQQIASDLSTNVATLFPLTVAPSGLSGS